MLDVLRLAVISYKVALMANVKAEVCGDDQIVTIWGQWLADNFFIEVWAIHLSSIEESNTVLYGCAYDVNCLLFV